MITPTEPPATTRANTSLFIATPAYDGRVTAQYVRSLLSLLTEARRRGVGFSQFILSGSSIIDYARTELVHEFLRSDATHLLFIDSDHGFDAALAFDMLAMGVPVIGCPYAAKWINWETVADAARAGVPASELAAAGSSTLDVGPIVPDGVHLGSALEVYGIGFGFMLIERAAITTLIEHNPSLRHNDRCSLFLPIVRDGQRYDEDYSLCLRWRDLGGKVYAFFGDSAGSITHVGTHVYPVRQRRQDV